MRASGCSSTASTLEDGATFTPQVLLVGGDGDVAIAPEDVTVTVRVVGQQRGPKIRIGKYKQRTGYRRHTGFRAVADADRDRVDRRRQEDAAAAKPKPRGSRKQPAARSSRAAAEEAVRRSRRAMPT